MNEPFLVAVGVAIVALWFFFRRANELCALSLSRDTVRLLRGRAPRPLLLDVHDVARRAALTGVTVRIVSEGGTPRLVAPKALPDAVVQQLRNVVGQYNVTHFRTGQRA